MKKSMYNDTKWCKILEKWLNIQQLITYTVYMNNMGTCNLY